MVRENQQVLQAFGDRCDPEPMLENSMELRKLYRPERDRARDSWMLYSANVCAALFALGRTGEMEAVLKEMEPWAEQSSMNIRCIVASHWTSLYLRWRQPEQALVWLERQEALLAGPFPQKKDADTWRKDALKNRQLYRLLTEGGSPELLAQFQDALERSRSETLYIQVHAHWNLARCLLDMKRAEEARPHLEFVAANGNKLAIRREAELRLRELEAE